MSGTNEAVDDEEIGSSPKPSLTQIPKVKSKAKLKIVEQPKKSGIIYLSTIPPKMNVTQIREYFSKFGDVNRSFLQPELKHWNKAKHGKVKNQTFTEGWIEFKKRKHAKRVAEALNNQPVGGKKSKAYHDHLWNIKYLKGFQWVHLNERLAYERISRQQKLRNEISAAKRESSFFAKNLELSKKLKKKGLLNKDTPRLEQKTDSASGEIYSKKGSKSLPEDVSDSCSNDTKKIKLSDSTTNDRIKFFKTILGK